MGVRYQQSVVIRQGDPAEEQPVNEVRDDGEDHELFVCDLILADESAAADAFNTLSDHNVLGQAVAIPTEEGGDIPSWVERHLCDHDEDDRSGCQVEEYMTHEEASP